MGQLYSNNAPCVIFTAMKKGRASGALKWALIIPVAGLVILLVVAAQKPDGRLHLWVLDVGQGNAVLVRTPRGHTAVIDGGPESAVLNQEVGRLVPFWQNKLDMVVLTAPKTENITGLVDLLAKRKVRQVVEVKGPAPQTIPDTTMQGAWREAVGQSGVEVHYAQRGDTISFDGEPEVVLRVLYPQVSDNGPILTTGRY